MMSGSLGIYMRNFTRRFCERQTEVCRLLSEVDFDGVATILDATIRRLLVPKNVFAERKLRICAVWPTFTLSMSYDELMIAVALIL